MLNDYWIIAQLLAQFCSLVLLTGAFFFSTRMVLVWVSGSNTELQLDLERQSYLVSAILQFILVFQLCSLLLFLLTVNNHLPTIIKGAMCATASLGVNEYGYRVLFLKIFALIFYSLFLIINYLDNSEPAYPLSPLKFWLVFPMLFILAFDFYQQFLYFQNIEPDIIATCCSVSFSASDKNSYALFDISRYTGIGFDLFIVLGSSLILFSLVGRFSYFEQIQKKKIFAFSRFTLSCIFIVLAVFTLKNFFVKYIYGLPSHNCLFDIFWARYYFIGYVLFASYFMMLISALFILMATVFSKKLDSPQESALIKARLIFLISTLISFITPLAYWWLWKGDL